MTPTPAIQVGMWLPPLHVMFVAEAQAGFYSLMCNQQWKLNSPNFRHVKKSPDMEH